ncbi:O-sialoglycoprotein endopeptidase [Wukongibacter baidiensis]|uniref:Kae1-like domain-containing protein n=1 Tax=Wukongibacter baidiensis TaxID=1723361 RepID=UPI003D7F7AA0
MSKYLLGIDTSCYTTSIAVVDEESRLVLEKRKILEVKKGNRGLRQSEAIFQHMKNFPDLYEEVCGEIDTKKIIKVCCSSKPRNLEGSYMPVFLSGVSFGRTIASSLNVSFEEYSHQEGHIEAARWSSDVVTKNEFIAVHISGGTTEILKVEENENRYECEIIGGTKDISAGQLVDRIGVMMGLGFPAGKELDKISEKGIEGKIKLPVSTKDTYINFSGVETFTKRLVEEGNKSMSDIAKALFACISRSLYNVIYESSSKYKINKILIAGGVASNGFLRDNLYRELNAKGISVHFGKPEFCTDNAVGTALLGIHK